MKDIVFDFGKVIAHFETNQVFFDFTETEEEAQHIINLFAKKKVWIDMDKGKPIDKIHNKLSKNLKDNVKDSIRKILDEWIHYLILDEDMMDYISSLKEKGHRIYLLSNISNQFEILRKQHSEFFKQFDGIYISSNRGYIKPTYMAYLDFLRMNRLEAENCVLIDDNEENLENPKELGFTVYHYDGNLEKLKKFIKSLE